MMKETEEMAEEQLTPEAARAALAQDQRRRSVACAAELRAMLAKYRVRLDWVETRRNGQVEKTGIEIVPED